MEISGVIGIGAALVHTLAYLDYNKDVLKGTRRPNGPTWLIWSALAALSASSYFIITSDWAKSILSLVNIALCILTFIIALLLKRFERPDKGDYGALALGLVATMIWWWYQSALYANLVLQFAIIVGFIPTFRLVWKNPKAEKPRPWFIWTVGYILLVVTVVLRWRDQWYDLVYPINCIVFHTAVAILALVRCQNKSTKQIDRQCPNCGNPYLSEDTCFVCGADEYPIN